MARRGALNTAADGVELNVLPFLDIIFATIGIFIVVFALQEVIESAAQRQAGVDRLVVCTDDGEVALYLAPEAVPRAYTRLQFPLLFEALAGAGGGIDNLVFAFGAECFNSQRIFAREFAKFTAVARGEQGGQKRVFRLSYRPLSAQPEAVEELLQQWRGENDDRNPAAGQ